MRVEQLARTLPKIALLLSILVVGLGAYTRLSDAGLGCPDWPGCYGQLSVPQTPKQLNRAQQAFPGQQVEARKAWIEMIHRYLAGSLGILVAIIWGLSLGRGRAILGRKLPSLLCILIVLQALLGMWTVTLKLWPVIVMAHLMGGLATTALIHCLNLKVQRGSKPIQFQSSGFKYWPLAFCLLIMQIILGGWTSANYASLACMDFPTCHGQWWPAGVDLINALKFWTLPDFSGSTLTMAYPARLGVHMLHRLGAVAVVISLGLLSHDLVRKTIDYTGRFWARLLALELLVQCCLGANNIWGRLPVLNATAHNLVAASLLLTMISIYHRAKLQPQAARARNV